MQAKRFKPNPVFDCETYQLPPNLKKAISLINRNFPDAYEKNLATLYGSYDGKGRLFGLITSYEVQNYCWMQITRGRSFENDAHFSYYSSMINKNRKSLPKVASVFIGMDCIAPWDDDGYFYRAIVVDKVDENRWLLIFIDYGNFQVTCRSKIRCPMMTPKCDHYQIPPQVICCRLYNIVPRHQEYRKEIDDLLYNFACNNRTTFLELKIRNIRTDYVVDCDIFSPHLGEDGYERYFHSHLGHQLYDYGLASYADDERAFNLPLSFYQQQKKERDLDSPTSDLELMELF